MNNELSVINLILEASIVVQLVMVILLLASLLSWTVIFLKWGKLRRAKIEARQFEDRFWSGADLVTLYEELQNTAKPSIGLARIFMTGFRDYAKLHKQQKISHFSISESVQRSMRVSLSREEEELERSLSFLATVGSTSPYVGLFGTVWGIMNSFLSLGEMEQATLAVVAPGIAEALIATAIGLFAAIPAVIAYNRFADDVNRLATRYDNFLEEFTALLQRKSASGG